MKRTPNNICHTCIYYYECVKMNLKPSIGECSIKNLDKRLIALQEIRDKIIHKRSVYLRHTVEVTEDFIGCPFPFTVRRVYLPEGVKPEGLSFALGTDSYGDTVWTDNISTGDVIQIAKELS